MRRSPRTRAVLGLRLLLVGGFGLFAASILLRSGDEASIAFDAGLYNVPFLAAGLLCLLAGGARPAWRFLGVGLLVFAAANAYATLAFLGDPEPPYPSLADAGWLLFYPLALIPVSRLGDRDRAARSGRDLLDGLLAALGVGALVASLALGPIIDATSGSIEAVVTNLAYPVGDLLLLMLVVGQVATRRLRWTRSALLLVAGLVTFAIADTAFLFESARGAYVEGGPLDLGWPAAAVLLGFAASLAHPAEAPAPAAVRPSGPTIWLPALSAVCAIGVLAGQAVTDVPAPAVVAAVLCLLLGVGRIVLAFRDLRSLAEARLEARTDDLTGLANRRSAYEQIALRLAAQEQPAPFALVLVDLDGFKQVNDELGHLTGDAVLVEVARRLRASASADAVTCRLGGDEFALIVDGGDRALERELRALRALFGHRFAVGDRRVVVGGSFGHARFPEDGATVDDLVRAADRAMYGEKQRERRRPAASGE